MMITGKPVLAETQLNGYLPKKDVENTIAKLQNSSFQLQEDWQQSCLLTQSENEKKDFSPLLQKEKIGFLNQSERTITCHSLERLFENAPEETALNLSQLKITDPEAQAVARAIEKNPQLPLQELNLSHNQIGDAEAKALAQVIEKNLQLPLQQLNLSCNEIGDTGVRVLAQAIEKNPQLPLQQLNLSGEKEYSDYSDIYYDLFYSNHSDFNKIGDAGVQALTQAIEKNPQLPLQQLNLASNDIGDMGAKALLKMIENNPHLSLQTLNLDANQIGDEGIEAFEKIYKTNRNLTTLFISSNQVGERGKRAIERIQKYQQIKPFLNKISAKKESVVVREAIEKLLKNDAEETRLDLSGKSIGNEGAKALAKALESNTSLTTLDLKNNPIEDEGLEALAKAYLINQNLQILEIASDEIGERGKKAIEQIKKYQQIKPLINEIPDEEKRAILRKAVQKLLKDDPKQISLKISAPSSEYWKINDKDITILAKALEGNRFLQQLNLACNEIGEAGAKALALAIEKNPRLPLEHLDLSHNKISGEGIIALAQAIENNKTLRQLNLACNQIGEAGAKAFALAIEKNPQLPLQQLELGANGIGNEGTKALVLAIEKNPQLPLRQLGLCFNKIGGIGTQQSAKPIKKKPWDRFSQRLHLHAKYWDGWAMTLAWLIEKNPQLPLQQLDLSCNKIRKYEAARLLKAIDTTQIPLQLDLRDNPIGNIGGEALIKAIETNQVCRVTSDISEDEVNRQVFEILLQKDSKVVSLDWSHQKTVEEYFCTLTLVIEKNQSLKQLQLTPDYKMDDAGAQAIALVIEKNQSLQQLTLSNNKIGIAGAEALAQAIKNNTTLQQLNLSNNEIGVAGAEALAQTIRNNKTLQQLNLSNNNIGILGIRTLAQAIGNNPQLPLQQLDLSYNEIKNAGAQALAQMIENNPQLPLRQLNLSSNKIGAIGTEALAWAIGNNVHLPLQQLDLSKNGIAITGAQALANMIENNHTLQQLHISNWSIGNIGLQALEGALGNNTSLLNLDLPNFNKDPITDNQINILLATNNEIAATFSEQTKPIRKALKQPDPILLAKRGEEWEIASKELIPSLEIIALQSGRKGLNEAHREKLQTTIDHLTHSFQKTLLNQFEDALALLSKKYFEERTTEAQRNLGDALYKTWANFFHSQCPNWLQTKTEEFTTLRLLLDIAEGNTAPYNLQEETPNIETLFHRLLTFKL